MKPLFICFFLMAFAKFTEASGYRNALYVSNPCFTFTKINFKNNYIIYVTIGYVLLISSHAVWWGGWSYGPRQLMPVTVLILFEAVLFISKQEINKKVFWICSSLFLLFAWLVKSTVAYSVPTEIKNPFKDYFFQNFLNGLSNSNNVLTIVMGFPPTLAAVNCCWAGPGPNHFSHHRPHRFPIADSWC